MSWVIARRRCPSGGAGFQAGGEWCEQQQLGLELIRIVRRARQATTRHAVTAVGTCRA